METVFKLGGLMAEYKTKQKDYILNLIKAYNREFTAFELYNDLNKKAGLTTVYRHLNKLLEEERLKIYQKNNMNYYVYLDELDSKNQYYLKCVKCHHLEKVDCSFYEELNKHLLKHHFFTPLEGRLIIEGVCKKCYKKEKE